MQQRELNDSVEVLRSDHRLHVSLNLSFFLTLNWKALQLNKMATIHNEVDTSVVPGTTRKSSSESYTTDGLEARHSSPTRFENQLTVAET